MPDNRAAGHMVVASNRRARANYDVLDTFDCGIVLRGSEVKSLRARTVQLDEAYALVRRNEMWLMGLQVAQWSHAAAHNGHVVDRPRKLLLHRAEIDRLRARIEQDRLQLIPLSLYFDNGLAKVELALAKGRRLYDKRQALRKRESDREAERALRYRRR